MSTLPESYTQVPCIPSSALLSFFRANEPPPLGSTVQYLLSICWHYFLLTFLSWSEDACGRTRRAYRATSDRWTHLQIVMISSHNGYSNREHNARSSQPFRYSLSLGQPSALSRYMSTFTLAVQVYTVTSIIAEGGRHNVLRDAWFAVLDSLCVMRCIEQ